MVKNSVNDRLEDRLSDVRWDQGWNLCEGWLLGSRRKSLKDQDRGMGYRVFSLFGQLESSICTLYKRKIALFLKGKYFLGSIFVSNNAYKMDFYMVYFNFYYATAVMFVCYICLWNSNLVTNFALASC